MFITDPTALSPFAAEKRIWQGIPSIERTPGGRLFTTFYSGEVSENYGNYCVILQSEDDGETWTEPVGVAYAGENSRCFDPELWLDPLGRLWFTWAQYPENTLTAVICEKPDADNLCWSMPRVVGEGVMMQKPVVLSSGEWLFPIAVWKVETDCNLSRSIGRACGAFVYRTDDNGKTFTKIGVADDPDSLYDEHTIIELENGVLQMFIRTFHGLSTCFSYDSGKTWSTPEKSELKNPSARIALRRLSSGNLLLVNHVNFTGRNNLTALLSRDDGLTWEGGLLLDGRNNVSYPDFTESDGFIYIVYDRERGCFKSSLAEAQADAREILFAKVTEADILAGTPVTTGSGLQKLVHKLTVYTGEDLYKERSIQAREAMIHRLARTSDPMEIADELFRSFGTNCAAFTKEKADKLDKHIEALGDPSLDIIMRQDIIGTIIVLLTDSTTNTRENIAEKQLVAMVVDYIRSHIQDTMNLQSIANHAAISRYYLCHVFKKCTGITVLQYQLELRLSAAKRLLCHTDKSITEIAMLAGFCSASYFTKVFRGCIGCVPSEYRKLHGNTSLS